MFQVRAYEARTVTWWYQRRDKIDFAPAFQRSGRLWSKPDKAYLIDSMLNDYDFPKLYLADFSYSHNTLNTGNKQFAVIDGRQRFEAIFGFIEDQFPLSEDFVFENDLELNLKGLTYSQLRLAQPEIALLFEQFNLPVMSVITDDSAKINQLFVRMNRNKPLTGAEVRNAMQGAVPPAIRKVASHPFFTQKCSFAKSRGQDRNAAAKLLLLTHIGQFVDTKKDDLDDFVKQFKQASSPPASLENALAKTLDVLTGLQGEFSDADPKLAASGLIPVYFRIAEEHGPKQFSDFLTVWNLYSSATDPVISEADWIDDMLKTRIRLFQVMKRNVNDSTAMQRLFTILSLEFARFRKGAFESAVNGIPRMQSRIRAAKTKAKQSRAPKT